MNPIPPRFPTIPDTTCKRVRFRERENRRRATAMPPPSFTSSHSARPLWNSPMSVALSFLATRKRYMSINWSWRINETSQVSIVVTECVRSVGVVWPPNSATTPPWLRNKHQLLHPATDSWYPSTSPRVGTDKLWGNWPHTLSLPTRNTQII